MSGHDRKTLSLSVETAADAVHLGLARHQQGQHPQGGGQLLAQRLGLGGRVALGLLRQRRQVDEATHHPGPLRQRAHQRIEHLVADKAAGASTMNFLRQLGGAIGVNAVGIMLEWRLQAHAALGAPGVLRAFHEVFVLMALVTGLAALAAWRMRPPRSV